jgi:hypothetical protein
MNLELLLLPNRQFGDFLNPRLYHRAWRVFRTDPARLALTPFADLPSNTVCESDLIDPDLEDRIRFGGHAALVTRRGKIVGLLTLASIQASRLRRFLRPREYIGTDGLYVADAMIPWQRVLKLNAVWLNSIDIRELLRMFHDADVMHIAVIEDVAANVAAVAGVVSLLELSSRLGCPIDMAAPASLQSIGGSP